ncbi:MAG: multicopper oxidase domain-containing protein [Corynebacterium camporealensis]|uniref:multicopper oxidase domain-containing protein n=1 Tax=Corynebacterium camporealensis TaxID=161896 RepID=UPI002A90B32E|nr:multicopper oxidase domain-containing protein [Corynebacterium camporealensis]MDY5840245.1 multicopper oxidase domain-containing protein [Corynebacterium camporealensis]
MTESDTRSTRSEWQAWLIIVLAIIAVSLLAVLNLRADGGNATATDNQPVTSGDTVTVDVSVEGMAFVPDSVDVPQGSHLVVNFTNTGDQVHDLKIGDAETGRVDPGDTVALDAGVINESIEGLCTIAGHSIQGMKFMVNVGEGDAAAAGGAGARGDEPIREVPTAADLTAPDDDFEAFDPKLASANGTVHEETWTMTEEIREVAPGVKQMQWMFNGQAPGPTLRGKVGDTFRITLKNEGTMGHSVDFHAGEVNPDENMKTIQPGEELTYEFTAKRSGIWMYHCATAPMSLHIANGMAGAVIIDPPELSDVDDEYALVASDFFIGEQNDGADPQRVADGRNDLMAFNYNPGQYVRDPLEAKVGDTVRFWVLNVGPDEPLSFHVVGEVFDTVYSEGRYLIQDETDTGSQALSLLPAQGGLVEMTFDEPGTYTFVNHVMTSAEQGQQGQIVVTE